MKAKSIVIDLRAIERVDPTPLRRALETVTKTQAEIASARTRENLLSREIRDVLASADPDDITSVQSIGAKRIQADIIPKLIARREELLDTDFIPDLARKAEQFRGALVQFYGSAAEIAAAEIAKIFRPYLRDRVGADGMINDRALAIARQSDDVERISERLREIQAVRIPYEPRSNDAAKFDRELCDAAKELLGLAGRD